MAISHVEVGLQLASARNHVTTPFRVTAAEKRTVAAVRKPEQSRSAPQRALIPAGRLRALPRPSWLAVAVAIAAVAGLTSWIVAQRAPDIDPRNLIASNLTAAQQALSAGRYLDPPENSAVHYYSTVLALDPANAEAAGGIDRIADLFLSNAKAFVVDGRIAEAVIALEDVRRLRPAHRRLPLIEAQLRKEMDNQVFLHTREPDAAPPQQARRRDGSGAAAKATAKSELEPASRMAARRDMAAPANLATSEAARHDAATSGAGEALTAAVVPPEESASGGDASGSAADAATSVPATTNASLTSPPALLITTDNAAESAGSSVPPTENAPAGTSAAAPPAHRAIVKYVAPEYPREALLRGIEGWVDMSLSVTPGGDVVEPRVSDGKGRQLFDRAALAAVRQWKYEPRTGQDAAQALQVRVSFRLED
jgi:TonB family protein